MSVLFMLAEHVATFTEGALALLTIGLLCGWKYSGKKRLLQIVGFSGLYTVLITAFNAVEMFSMGTMLAAILIISGISHFQSRKNFGYRLLVAVLYFFMIAIIDSVVNIVVGVVMGDPSLPMHIVSTIGINRTIYILSVKMLEVLIYLVFRKKKQGAPRFSLPGLFVSVLLTLVAFFSVYYTYKAVLSLSVQLMQLSLALAWVAMLASIVLIQILFSVKAKDKEKQQENEMLRSVNAVVEENYKNLERAYLENAKNIHDFKHHISALDELMAEGKLEEARSYIGSLHEAGAHIFSAVITGNPVADAVLNAHHSKAEEKGIDFSVTAQPLPGLKMGSWELSALLSNLLENAREACEKVAGRKPWITVEITVNKSFLFLVIRNTSDSCPGEGKWETSKKDRRRHGLGIHSVEDIVRKYSGDLKRSCPEEGVVEVSVMCEAISTKFDSY